MSLLIETLTEMNIILLILAALLSGYIEQYQYRNKFLPMGSEILGWLIAPYHIPLGLLWFTICLLAGHPQAFPAFCVLQDWSWWRFHPHRELDPRSWGNAGLGGFFLRPKTRWGWVPFSYILGVSITVGSYYYFPK